MTLLPEAQAAVGEQKKPCIQAKYCNTRSRQQWVLLPCYVSRDWCWDWGWGSTRYPQEFKS